MYVITLEDFRKLPEEVQSAAKAIVGARLDSRLWKSDGTAQSEARLVARLQARFTFSESWVQWVQACKEPAPALACTVVSSAHVSLSILCL